MLKDKNAQERFEALKSMNFLVKSLNDETAYYSKWIWIIPDEADEEELADIAENDVDIFADAVKCFRSIIKNYADDGFCFGDEVY